MARHWWDIASWLTVTAGVAVRLFLFFDNRSLWLDEAALASGVANFGMDGLAPEALGGQTGPLGFIFLTRLLLEIFGPHEFVYRTLPLIGGVGLLFVARFVSRELLKNPLVQIWTLSLFAFSPILAHYSQEFKQYSSDAFASALVVVIGLWIWRRKKIRWVYISGFLLALFSMTALVGLAALGLLLVVDLLRGEHPVKPRQLAAIGLWWGVGAGIQLFYQLEVLNTGRSQLREIWSTSFPPSSSFSNWESLQWYADTARNFLSYPFTGTAHYWSTSVSWLILIFLVILIISAFSLRQQAVLIIALPVLLGLLMAEIGLYPFNSRLVIYLIPSLFFLLGLGLDALIARKRWVTAVAILLASAPLMIALTATAEHLNENQRRADIRGIFGGPLSDIDGITVVTNGATRQVHEFYHSQKLISQDPDFIMTEDLDEASFKNVDKTTIAFVATHRAGEVAQLGESIAENAGLTVTCKYLQHDTLVMFLETPTNGDETGNVCDVNDYEFDNIKR